MQTKTVTFEVSNDTNYQLLLTLGQQLEGVFVKKQVNATKKAIVSLTQEEKVTKFDITALCGVLKSPATEEETILKLQSIRDEWDRNF